MNSLVYLLGVFSLVLHDICLAKVFVKYAVKDDIGAVYAERKKDDRHLGHLATLTQEERLAACKFYRPGEYLENEESKPHMYEVDISDSVIPKEVSDEIGSSKLEEPESPKTAAEEKGPMDVNPTAGELKVEKLKLKEIEQEKPELKKEEAKKEPAVIYDEEIGFRCQSKNPDEEDFIISYGFAQEMFFVSKPVGEIDKKKRFSGRKMQLEGFMFVPPILENFTKEQLHQKYYDLRERTEKARDESDSLMKNIDENDDISALIFEEKNILCASILDTEHYKKQGYQFVAAEDAKDYEYVKHTVAFTYEKMPRTFKTDFMKCKAKKENSSVNIIGVTRSYAEGGDVFTSVIDESAEKQFIDVEVVKIPVLFNRKYAGKHISKSVLDVLDAIRTK